MPKTGAISGALKPKDKTKSNPLAREKVRCYQCHYEEGAFARKELQESKNGIKMNRDNKSTSLNDKLDLEI